MESRSTSSNVEGLLVRIIDPDGPLFQSVPSTVKMAVDMIVSRLTDEDRKAILASKESHCVHHTIGRYLRNNWSLWEPDTPLKRDAVNSYGIAHPDDISGLILSWVWAKVHERPFDPVEAVKVYHEHWKKAGIDSLTAGGWPPKKARLA